MGFGLVIIAVVLVGCVALVVAAAIVTDRRT